MDLRCFTRSMPNSGLVCAAGDFKQVEAELSFHRTLDFTDGGAEYDGVELRNHLTSAKGAQFAALLTGGAAGVLFGEFGEVCAAGDLLFKVVTGVFGRDEDVAGAGSGHGDQPFRIVDRCWLSAHGEPSTRANGAPYLFRLEPAEGLVDQS